MEAIQDEFSNIPDKRARLYFRRKRDGVCVSCGKTRLKPYLYCKKCRKIKTAHYHRTKKLKGKPTSHRARPSKYSQFITNEKA